MDTVSAIQKPQFWGFKMSWKCDAEGFSFLAGYFGRLQFQSGNYGSGFGVTRHYCHCGLGRIHPG